MCVYNVYVILSLFFFFYLLTMMTTRAIGITFEHVIKPQPQGWSVLMPSLENIQSARSIYDEHNPLLDQLKSSQVFVSASLKATSLAQPLRASSPGPSDSEYDINDIEKPRSANPKRRDGYRRSGSFRKKEKLLKSNSKTNVTDTGPRLATRDPRAGGSHSDLLEDVTDDDIIQDNKYDKNGWTYSQQLVPQHFAWKSTDSPQPDQVFRRRLWVRVAIWQPKIRPTSDDQLQPEYLMGELLEGILWHVHLMSHESLVNILIKKEASHIEKRVLGKAKKVDNHQAQYRKRKDLKPDGRKKMDNVTNAVALSPIAGTTLYQRIADLFFVEN
ncbi:hypothetical protein RFI_22019, partial [Reticulomyxa filosa]